jgi:hypothetical protein
MEEKIGSITLLVGIVICIITGFVREQWLFILLTIIGMAVGVLHFALKDAQAFVIIALGVVIISAMAGPQLQAVPEVGRILGRIYTALVLFITPVATVVGLKALFMISRR